MMFKLLHERGFEGEGTKVLARLIAEILVILNCIEMEERIVVGKANCMKIRSRKRTVKVRMVNWNISRRTIDRVTGVRLINNCRKFFCHNIKCLLEKMKLAVFEI